MERSRRTAYLRPDEVRPDRRLGPAFSTEVRPRVATIAPSAEVVERLTFLYHRNGYVRRVNALRRKREGVLYKKGAEVRLVAESAAELSEIRRLLRRAGFKVCRPFAKAQQWRQPVYGIEAVARFLALVGKKRSRRRRAASGRRPKVRRAR